MPLQPKTLKLEAAKMPPRDDPRREPEPDGDGVEGNPAPPTVQEMFAFMSEQLADIAHESRAGRRETSELRGEVMPHIRRLNRRVFGSKPPPFMASKPPALDGELAIPVSVSDPPLAVAVVTQHDTIETLTQEVSNVRGEVTTARGELKELREINAQQSRAQGLARPGVSLGRRTRAYVGSRAGVRDIVLLIGALSALVGVWRGFAPSPAAITPNLSTEPVKR